MTGFAEELVDIRRWVYVMFASREMAKAAQERYRELLEREREEWTRMFG